MYVAGKSARVWVICDEPHGASHGPCAVKCPLRSAEDFDPREIEYKRIYSVRQRQIVKVKARRTRSLYAPDSDAAALCGPLPVGVTKR